MLHKGMMIGTQNTLIHKIGFWAAVVVFIGAVGYIVSVPLQIFNVVNYFQDSVIAFGFSLIIPASFLVAMVALHYTVSEEKKFWTHAAVVFAVIYTTYCTLKYVVQLTIVLPAGYSWTFANQQGTLGPLSLLNQPPHSLFWDIDGLCDRYCKNEPPADLNQQSLVSVSSFLPFAQRRK